MWRSYRNRWYPRISGAAATMLLLFLIATTGIQLNAASVRLVDAIQPAQVQSRASGIVASAAFNVVIQKSTKEVSSSDTCSHAAWPSIPVSCLDGGDGRDVRLATAGLSVKQDMQQRFADAFD
jgi:hypothetical protein